MANIEETDMSDMSKQQVWIVKHKLNESQRYYVLPRYRSRKKSKVVAYLLWFLFGLHYFYLGKSTRNILLWLSFLCLGLGLFWWIVDVARISTMVDEYNDQLLMDLVRESRVIMNDTYEK